MGTEGGTIGEGLAETGAVPGDAAPSHFRHGLRAMRAIIGREIQKFAHQYGRMAAAVARPAMWLIVAVGMQYFLGQSVLGPTDTILSLPAYMIPGLVGLVLLFNGMQSSLSLVHDREFGMMRLFLTTPLPRWYLLLCKLVASTILSIGQAYAFLALATLVGVTVRWGGWLAILPAMAVSGFLLGAIGLLLSVTIRQLENFAGTMNFVIFPMFFLSSALYPLDRFREHGTDILYWLATINPFTYAVELIRAAGEGMFDGRSFAVVAGVGLVCFLAAALGYGSQRGFLRRRSRPAP